MLKNHIPLLMSVFLIISSCTKNPDELILDPETEALVSIMQDELFPLDKDPLEWEDQSLRWLDPLASKSVIGLGEATHGTAEFFDAKHRIFKYMVENHGYKIFAIEADFGESLYIDEVVQQGNVTEIKNIMNSRMHFWTWKTEEVRELLEWMCTYNQGKSDEEKVHYMGVDCQFNTYHPAMAKEYLERMNVPFLEFADSILQIAETESPQNFDSFSSESFNTYVEKLEALQDSMMIIKDVLVAASSAKEYQLQERILELVRQVSEVKYQTGSPELYSDTRDKYMANNTAWLLDYFENNKVVLWAHNYHVSDFESGVLGTMGNYLSYRLGDQYAIIGFLFSQGSFTAVTMEGQDFTGLDTQTISDPPKENSINALMSYTELDAFSVEVASLQNYLGWYNAFEAGMEYFFIGSAYNNHPGDYYVSFFPDLYHYLIYFDKTNASELL
jgi:erythromycin esterase